MLIADRNGLVGYKGKPYDARVEYLEGGSLDSGIAFIDTGYTPNSSTKAVATMSIFSNWGYCGRFGDRKRFAFGGANGQLYVAQGEHHYLGAFVRGRIYSFVNDVPNRTVSVEGASSATASAVSDWLPQLYPIYLFASNLRPNDNGASVNGCMLDSNSLGQARIYSCKFYDGQTLVRDFIPVRFKNEQGQREGAMYDRANPTAGMNPDGSARTDGLYRNRGMGAFVIGPDVRGGQTEMG